jgi:hypothetical protein
MPTLETLRFFREPLLGGLLALAVSAAILLLDWIWARRGAAVPRPRLGALAVGSGYAAGQIAMAGWPMPPSEAVHRLLYLTLGATVLAVCLVPRPSAGPGGWAWRLALLLAAWAYLLLAGVVAWFGWTAAIGWLLGAGAIGIAVWYCLADIDAERSGPFPPLLLLALCLGSAAVLAGSHNAVLGQLAGILAAALLPALLRAGCPPAFVLGPGAVQVVTVALPGMWLIGAFNEVPASRLLLLALVPAVAWLLRGWSASRLGTLARGMVCLIPIAVALALVLPTASGETDEANSYPVSLPAAHGGSQPRPAEPGTAAPPVSTDAEEDNPFRRFTAPTTEK